MSKPLFMKVKGGLLNLNSVLCIEFSQQRGMNVAFSSGEKGSKTIGLTTEEVDKIERLFGIKESK